jgi:hypothetical protein
MMEPFDSLTASKLGERARPVLGSTEPPSAVTFVQGAVVLSTLRGVLQRMHPESCVPISFG